MKQLLCVFCLGALPLFASDDLGRLFLTPEARAMEEGKRQVLQKETQILTIETGRIQKKGHLAPVVRWENGVQHKPSSKQIRRSP